MTDKSEIAVRAATAMIAAGVAALNPVAGLLAAGAKEAVDPALHKTATWLADAYRQRVGLLLWTASQEAGMEPEALVDRLARDEPRLALMADTVQASMKTGLREKIVALARALTNVLHDGAKVDEERLIVAALAQIEAPHVQVLGLLTKESPVKVVGSPDVPDTVGNTGMPRRGSLHETRTLGWLQREIVRELPGTTDVIRVLTSTLTGAALIEDIGPTIPEYADRTLSLWRPTAFGRRCLARLTDAAGALASE